MRNFTDQIRIAETDEERRAIFAFRYRVYIEEMGKPYKNADHENKLLTDELDDCATLLYVETDNEIIGTVRINWGCEEKVMSFYNNLDLALPYFSHFPSNLFSFNSRLMTSLAYRNTLLPKNLAEESYRLGRENGVYFNFISCKPILRSFLSD